MRSPVELRKADVKFTPECLGFANVPEASTLETITSVPHQSTMEAAGAARCGSRLDFDDVRDFYLRHLFNVDPVTMRSFDTAPISS